MIRHHIGTNVNASLASKETASTVQMWMNANQAVKGP
jgi:hypothetical protein